MNYLVWVLGSAVALTMAAPPIVNGNFRCEFGGVPTGWVFTGSARLVPNGGRGGLPAVELECSGNDTSYALQTVDFNPPRKQGFVITAWVRCDKIGEGGDCALWLDVFQKDGPPIWAVQGLPDRTSRRWQQVRAEVRPTHAVSRVNVHLILRNVKGRVRFCDVRFDELPFDIKLLRAYRVGPRVRVSGLLTEAVSWRIEARQEGKEVWRFSGEGDRVATDFELPWSGRADLTLIASKERQEKRKSVAISSADNSPGLALDWWVVDSFSRVFQDDLPPDKPAREARLDMARGESESFQICLWAPFDRFEGVKVCCSPLRLEGSSPELSGSEIPIPAWYRVGYVWVERPFDHPFSPRRTACWWPDPLLPPCEFALEAGQVQPLWVTVTVPRDAVPGKYVGLVTIVVSEDRIISVPVSVTVYKAQVPIQGRMKTTFALMDGHLEKVYGVITPEIRRAYTDFLLEHRLNPDDISRTTLPNIEELVYANTRGLNAFNILNIVPERKPGELWVCFAPVDAYTPEFKKRFFEKLDAFVPLLEQRGLIDKAYVYGFDERGAEYVPVMKEFFGEIKRRYPKIRTLSTCWLPPDVDPASLSIDWLVVLSSWYDHGSAQEFRKKGGEVWWYVCMGPRQPYANWLLEHPLIEARLIWWQALLYDVEGFLYWGLNIWERRNNDKPIPDQAGPRIDWSVSCEGEINWLNGDGVLLYPGVKGPISSLRLENIRDGLEDTELLYQYKTRFGPAAARRVIGRVTKDRTHYSRNPAHLLAARFAVLRAL
ncbi:MAG: DUF4091 domain-containing protein [Armatimonadetes bacterium]|nr:DUF4091 domain-containing protein [Armatimonadota bacterium]